MKTLRRTRRQVGGNGDSKLLAFIKRRDLAGVQQMLAGLDVTEDGIMNGFYAAIKGGYIPVIKAFLADKRVDVNKPDKNGNFPLYVAVMTDRPDVLKLLFEDPRIDINKRNIDNKLTPFIAAVENGMINIDIIHLFLNDPRTDVNLQKADGSPPLAAAVEKGNIQIVELLLKDRRVDVNNFRVGSAARPPLVIAIEKGYINIVESLLRHKDIDVNQKLTNGFTPLITTLMIKKPDAIQFEIIGLLLADKRIDVNATSSNERMTAIHFAVYYDDIDVVRLLLEDERVDLNITDTDGMSILNTAVYGEFEDIVRLLLDDLRMDVNIEDNDGISALHLAAKQGYTTIVRMLLEDARTVVGERVIEDARAGKFNDEIKELLLPVAEAGPVEMWKGFTRSDITIMDTIFDTAAPPGEKAPALNWSACPVCLKYAERSEACKYMKHDCRKEGGYYNKQLYDKYKNTHGYIEWCTICGRISEHHQHFALASYDTTEYTMATVQAGANAFSDDCKLEGGGGIEEKILRFRRLREHAKLLNKYVGEITQKSAYDSLVHETWNAPLIGSAVGSVIARKIASERKWNIPVENFPPNGVSVVAAAAERNAENVKRPAENVAALRPVVLEEGEDSLLGGDGPFIQFHHRQKDGTINHHLNVAKDLIGQESIVIFIENMNKTFKSAEFGYCWQYPMCTARLYPDEIKDFVSAEVYEDYRKKFNRKFAV